MSDRFWVGGSGLWSQSEHWSTTSGGIGGSSIPTSADNVYFDTNSFTSIGQIVTMNTGGNCLSMDWTGALYVPTFSGNYSYTIYGSLTYITSMTLSQGGSLYLRGSGAITTAGIPITTNLLTNAGTPNYTLLDDITVTSASGISWTLGMLNTNGKKVTTTTFVCNGTNARTLTLGTSEIVCSGNCTFASTGLTFNVGTSTIKLTGSNATFAGGNLTYNNVEIQGTSASMTGSNTFNGLVVKSGKSLRLTDNTTQTVYNLVLESNSTLSSYNPANIILTSTYSPPLPSGVIKTDSISITTPNAPNKRYWVGQTGNWSENRWSVFSGWFKGAPLPTANDDVYFDKYSFTSTGQMVFVDYPVACKDLDFREALNTPTLSGNAEITINGLFNLNQNMKVEGNAYFNLCAANKVMDIQTYGNTITGIKFNGSGSQYKLACPITTRENFTVSKGTVDTNNYDITCGSFSCMGADAKTLILRNSRVTCSGDFYFSTEYFTLNSGLSVIEMTGDNRTFSGAYQHFNRVEFNGDLITVSGSNKFKTLKIAPHKNLNLTSGTTQTIDRLFMDNANLQNTGEALATIESDNEQIIKSAFFAGINAIGTFYAIRNSTYSNCTGITFTEPRINKVKLYDNQKVDYLVMLNHTATQTDLNTLQTTKFQPTWDSFDDIVIMSPFKENLVSSYITGLTSTLTGFTVYRQKKDESVLHKVADLNYDKTYVLDYLVANRHDYRWTVVPVTEQEIGVSLMSDYLSMNWDGWSITSLDRLAEGVYVADQTWIFNMGLGSPIASLAVTQNIDVTQFKTLSKYPKTAKGSANYVSGSVTGLIGNINCLSGNYEEPAAKINAWMDFVATGKLCLLKDTQGQAILCNILQSSYQTDSTFQEHPTTITFDYVEVSDSDNVAVYGGYYEH